jgi:hypothetical protein
VLVLVLEGDKSSEVVIEAGLLHFNEKWSHHQGGGPISPRHRRRAFTFTYSIPHIPPAPVTSTTHSNSHTGETAQRDRGARVHPPCWLHRRSSQGVYAKRSPLRLALISFFLFLCSVRSSSKFLIWPRRRTPTTTSSSYATRCARRHSSLSFSHTKPKAALARTHSTKFSPPFHLGTLRTHAHVLVGEHRKRSSMWSSASYRTWPRS